MPYEVKLKDGEFCVFKEGSTEPMKCYPTEDEAKDYMAALYANVSDAKMGARNSAKDKERIQTIKDAAKTINETADELQPEEAIEASVKSSMSIPLTQFHIKASTEIKASGDMELDVLLVPFGGPENGKDTDGQYFDETTDTQHNIYKTIPAYYYHGYDPNGNPQGNPEVIGMMHYDHTDAKGHWYRAILDKASALAKRIWEAAKNGLARASSGSIPHIIRDKPNGHIDKWPVVEGSLIDEGDKRHPANAYAVALPVMKARYEALKLAIPSDLDDNGEQSTEAAKALVETDKTKLSRSIKMADEEVKDVQKLVADAFAAKEAEDATKAAKAAELQAEIDKAVKAATDKLEKEFAEQNRIPGGMPYVKKYGDTNQFDNLDAADLATMVGVLKAAKKPVSESALKALTFKLDEDKTEVGNQGRKAMKAVGLKAGEIDYSTSSGYGDQWVDVAYSSSLWNSIRQETFVADLIPSVEFPRGVESMILHLEGTDPVWYNVSENTTNGSTVGAPAPTVTSSRLGTPSNVTMTLGKLGARVNYTGELEESSMIPFANQLRTQLATSGAEYFESAIIDGDTETTDSTNINNIGGAEVTGGHYLIFNGFRKSALVTNLANHRHGGALTVEDYIETLKLMGAAGKNALDKTKTGFIIDANTYWKTMGLPEVLTRDVFSSPVIENGDLKGLWGRKLNVSGSMHFMSDDRKADANGKVNTTDTTQNLYGAILAVRYDQWKLGWMRHMKMTSTYFANSDTNEIVALMRVGLIQRDTEASAMTVGLSV